MSTAGRPTFSFLTTAYRTEAFVGATIESVLAQTRDDWEMVIVDNGNSDEMAAIVAKYADLDPRIKLIRQENRGYRGGVGAAADNATGRYLCVFDSDDLVEPTYCERIGTYFDARPQVDAIGTDAYMFTDGDEVSLPRGYLASIGVRKPPSIDRRLTISDVLGGIVPVYAGAVRREAWDAVGGYASAADDVEEDVDLWLRLLAKDFEVRLLPERLVRCRVRGDSLSRDPSNVEAFEARLQRTFVAATEASECPAQSAAVERTLRWFKYHQSLRRARWALLDGDSKSARVAALEAFRTRRTLRAAAVVGAVTLVPGLLRAVHPVKHRLSGAMQRARGRVAEMRRPSR